MANLKNITELPVANSAGGLNLIVNDSGTAKQIAASKVGAQADWSVTDNTNPAFIKNKPTIPAAQVQSDWNQNDPAAPDYIKNRPLYCDKRALLWENQSIGPFSEKTIQVQSGYDSYEFVFIVNVDAGHYVMSQIVTPGEYFTELTYASDNAYYTRSVSFSKNQQSGLEDITFGDGGRKVAGQDWEHHNKFVVPIKIFGTKNGGVVSSNTQPLILDANLSDYYGGHSEAGDAALEAIKTGKPILVKVPNAKSGNYVVNYSPIYMYQVPTDGMYLYLFYLRDDKQDLSALLGQPAGTILLPTYGEFMMLLSKHYNSDPLESN